MVRAFSGEIAGTAAFAFATNSFAVVAMAPPWWRYVAWFVAEAYTKGAGLEIDIEWSGNRRLVNAAIIHLKNAKRRRIGMDGAIVVSP